jgi:hypothetical protein
MKTGLAMSGNADVSVMVQIFSGPPLHPWSELGMSNAIASTASVAAPATQPSLVSPLIASRSVQTPSFATVSAVLLTVMVTGAADAKPAAASKPAATGDIVLLFFMMTSHNVETS